MSRTRKLSLRARMLVMLVGVTTVLLLIMGTVSTYLLARRVDGQAAAVAKRLSNTASGAGQGAGAGGRGDWLRGRRGPAALTACRRAADQGHSDDASWRAPSASG